MANENVAVKLLNRTRYAQNRTKFYTVRNTVLAQTERPLFVTGSLQDALANRKSLSLKKAFLNRRSSRRGPFQRLSLPHEYFRVLGDPAYYSLSDLVSVCESASADRMADPYFWRQICERLREVRDLMDIHDLLKCLSSITTVNYYDRDLLRVLSREFVDDMAKLSLDELAQLLHCYLLHNVYSVDLVEAVGLRVLELVGSEAGLGSAGAMGAEFGAGLGAGLGATTNASGGLAATATTTQPTFLDRLRGRVGPSDPPQTSLNFRSLATITRCLRHFNYSNPDFYRTLATLFTTHSHSMDVNSRLEIFCHLRPSLVQGRGGAPNHTSKLRFDNTETEQCHTGQSGLDQSLERGEGGQYQGHDQPATHHSDQPTNPDPAHGSHPSHTLLSSILDSLVVDPSTLTHLNHLDIHLFLSSHLFADSNSKLVHDLCALCCSTNLLSNSIHTLVDYCLTLQLSSSHHLDSLLSLLSGCCRDLLSMSSQLPSPSPLSGTNSPFLRSLRHLIISSVLSALTALNTCLRLKVDAHALSPPTSLCTTFSFTLDDDNIHSRFFKGLANGLSEQGLELTQPELDLLSVCVTALSDLGCSSQYPPSLATAFETLVALGGLGAAGVTPPPPTTTLALPPLSAISPQLLTSLHTSLAHLSSEITLQLVHFDRPSLYRVVLAANLAGANVGAPTQVAGHGSEDGSSLPGSATTAGLTTLTHYLASFPKLLRRRHLPHHVSFSSPLSNSTSNQL